LSAKEKLMLVFKNLNRFGMSTAGVVGRTLAGIALVSLASAAGAADDSERLSALEEQVSVLAEELDRAVTGAAVPEDGNWENYFGVGPAAAKIYRADKGLSIGGYGEVLFTHYSPSTDKGDTFDTYRAVLYVGYKFSDKWVLNSEFEFEHAGGSDVFVEFLNLDYQHSEALNFRVGLILNPMGFVNQLHEPTFYYGGSRPEVEQRMIPTTWRENGAGFYGRVADRITYQAYALTSLDGIDFSGKGYRDGRQKGIKAKAENWSFVARADIDLAKGLIAGGSVYTGNQGQNLGVGSLGMTMYEVHAAYQRYGLTVRGLLSQSFIDNPNSLNLSADATKVADNGYLAEESLGWYVVGAYDVMPLIFSDSKQSLEPFFRYESVNTQKEFQTAPGAGNLRPKYNNEVITAGLQYKPLPQLVFKLDYRYSKEAVSGKAISKAVQVGVGYVF
jgi:opacity protein-like surface antigen